MTFTPWKARSAAVLSGLLLAAAFPPLNWWPLALVALVPLLLAVWSRSSKAVPALMDATKPNVGRPGGESVLVEEGQHSVDPCGQNVRTPNSGALPMEGDGASVGTGTRGRDSLADGAGLETNRRDACAPVFWPAFRLGWLFGFVFFTATLWWIQHVTLPGMLAMTVYLALYPAVAIGVAGWLRVNPAEKRRVMVGKLILVAGVWTGLEWVRSVAPWGFPWNGLATPLFHYEICKKLAASIGVIGLSSLVFTVTSLLVLCIWMRKKQPISLAGLLLAMIILVHLCDLQPYLTNSSQGQSAIHQGMKSAILIQPNVTMEEKMSPDPEVQRQRYFALMDQTNAALASADGSEKHPKPDLVVWPESAVPGFFDEMVAGGAFVDQLKQGDFSLVTGADHREWDKLYNSIAVMRGTVENRAIHPKIRLVPFGEFIPLRKEVPLFEKLLGNLIPMDFNAGTSLEPMRVEGQPFSMVPLVCFEDTLGEHARRFIRAEPQVMVNVTNDNWFHESPATEMHFANARWRAVELRRTLVRSANTGVTAIVSPWGHVQRISSHQQGVVSGEFSTGTGEITFYARHGDLFSQVAGTVGLLGCVAVAVSRRRRRFLP